MVVSIRCPECGRQMTELIDESWVCPCGYRIDMEPEHPQEHRDRLQARAGSVSQDQSKLFGGAE